MTTPEIYNENSIADIKYRLTRELDIDFLESASCAVGVRNEEEAKQALSMALQTRKLEKALDESRLKIIKPHFDFQKAVNQLVKDFKDKLKQIEKNLKKKIDDWIEESNKIPFALVEKIKVEDGSLTVKKNYSFYVNDESLVPREYLKVDSEKVEKDIKSGVRFIKGIIVMEVTETALRINNERNND